MQSFITLPGIGGSGEMHWQTEWEKADSRFRRFKPASWDRPELANWIHALQQAIDAAAQPPVLVAHSLACLLVAHWATRSTSRIAGAFLVCVPDPDGPNFPEDAPSFRGVPTAPLPFPTLIIASADDPYSAIEHARGQADAWKASLISLGALGHINASSGVGVWPEGRALFDAFHAGLGLTISGPLDVPEQRHSGQDAREALAVNPFGSTSRAAGRAPA